VWEIFVQVAILIDDLCDTGNTLTLAASTLKEAGARSVYALVSHGASTESEGVQVGALSELSCAFRLAFRGCY
jgi:phosphoribosylpyrophosphate synthetase